VGLKVPKGTWRVKWLNIEKSSWQNEEVFKDITEILLKTPGMEYWLALVSLVV
jgi:hypothetical protein